MPDLRLFARSLRALFLAAAGAALPACPSDDSPPSVDAAVDSIDAAVDPVDGSPDPGGGDTAVGLISIQDQIIHGAPAAGHGLSVRADFTLPGRAPDFDEAPGQPTGCKAWLYDAQEDPRPAVAGDEGRVTVGGTSAPVPEGCVFDGSAAYVCPVASGTGALASVTPMSSPTALYDIAGLALSDDDIGRYLRVAGDRDRPGNDGFFPIVAVPGPTSAVVVNGAASAGGFAADYTVVAGAGAAGLPLDSPHDPIRDGDQVVIGIEPGGRGDFDFPDTAAIDAGDSFELDDASEALIGAIPVDGSPFSLGCSGDGGRCGEAFASIIQLESTDGDLAGASPFALPRAQDKTVIISCATLGASGRVDVPAEASQLLRAAHEARPITRIRVAFMRDGFAPAANPPPGPANPVRIVAGHQIVAFTTDPGGAAAER
jgi:hypothetical protein